MDFSSSPNPPSEYNKQRSEAHFTVQSANSHSNTLTRRTGDRKPRGVFLEEVKQSTEEDGDRKRYGTHTSTNGTNKQEDHTLAGYQTRGGSRSGVKGQCGDTEISACKMSTTLNPNGSKDKTNTEFAADRSGNCNPSSESRGRTDWRRFNLPSRSRSLDMRCRERSPDWAKKTDVFMMSTKRGEDVNTEAGGFEETGTGVEGMRGRVISSVLACNSAGSSNAVQEREPLSQILDRNSRGQSFPSRLRSRSGPSPEIRTASTFGSKGGQSILERIEKLYGSAGFGKDCSNIRDFSTSLLSHNKVTADFISPQQRSYAWAAWGTLPSQFSPGGKGSISPVQNRESFTVTKKHTSESSFSPGTSNSRERLSLGSWQGQTQDRYSEERGVGWGRGFEEIGTKSLDRARRKQTLATQTQSEGAAGQMTAPPEPNNFSEEGRLTSLRDLSVLRENWASGSKDQGRVTHGEEKVETNGVNKMEKEITGWLREQEREKEKNDGAKEKSELKISSTNEDVFDSNPKTITKKTPEKKKFPEMLSIPSAASVKNKINQFEALTQRSQVLLPRRAFSVPTPFKSAHDVLKKSVSAKAIGELRDKWERSKEGEEAGETTGQKATLSDKNVGPERSISLDEVGLRLGRTVRERNELIENEGKQTDGCNNSAEGFDKYPRLTSALEVPQTGGAQRLHGNIYIDETDFSKVSNAGKGSKRPPSLLLSNPSDASPVSDDEKTPTNSPDKSPPLSFTDLFGNSTSPADNANGNGSVLTQAVKTEGEPPPVPHPLADSSNSNLPDLVSPDVNTAHSSRKKPVMDMDAWLAGLNTMIKVGDYDEVDYEDDDDDSTQKDEDSNYDSDSGESSVTIISNMSQSDRRSFSVSLSDLCNFAGVDYESENDSDDWQFSGRRSASLSSDMSAFSCVSVLPTEELDKLLEDVKSLGDSNLQDYNDVQVVVLHKEVGVGLGFSVAGGLDQNKPITVHKVFPSGVAAQEGSIRAGDQVLSINGTSLCDYVHWEALRVLRRAKARDMAVVVLRRGGISSGYKGAARTNNPQTAQIQSKETGQHVCVRLEKNNRDLGFSLEGGVGSSLEDRPITVQRIFQGGPADKVCPGDEVLEIEGVSVVGMRRLEAWTLIRRLPDGPVDVVLHRSLKNLKT